MAGTFAKYTAIESPNARSPLVAEDFQFENGSAKSEGDKTLWGGWLFEWNNYRIYFAGDTGYSALFEDIHNRFGDVDICLMPIAAWYWRHRHFAPEDAILAAEDLSCNTFIPWAWGNWIISYEHMLEPTRSLEYAWDKSQPQNMDLRILKMGETYSTGLFLIIANRISWTGKGSDYSLPLILILELRNRFGI